MAEKESKIIRAVEVAVDLLSIVMCVVSIVQIVKKMREQRVGKQSETR